MNGVKSGRTLGLKAIPTKGLPSTKRRFLLFTRNSISRYVHKFFFNYNKNV